MFLYHGYESPESNNFDGFVYVVDSTHEVKFPKIVETFKSFVNDEKYKGKPLLIFSNMCDKPSSKANELKKMLEIENLKDQKVLYQESSFTNDQGIVQGFDWLFSCLEKNKK